MYPQHLMATKPQIQKINIMLRQLKAMDMKEDLVKSFSNERTTHISELTKLEAKYMISHIVKCHPVEKQRQSILSLAYKAGIIYGNTWEDKQMNMAKIDGFLLSRGTVRKRFSELSYEELVKVHRQFEGIVSNTSKTAAKKATDSVLKELGIEVSTKQ